MLPRSARRTRQRYAIRNSPLTSKKPTNWASDWLRNVRKNSIENLQLYHMLLDIGLLGRVGPGLKFQFQLTPCALAGGQ